MNEKSQLEKSEKDQQQILMKLLKLINLIGILASLFGFNYSYGLLKFLYGDKWTTDVIKKS